MQNNALNRSGYTDDLNSESVATFPINDQRNMNPGRNRDKNSTINSVPTGRNTFAFWVIVSIIFIMTIGNLILTMTIIGVLRLGKGMAFMEMVPEAGKLFHFSLLSDNSAAHVHYPDA